MKKWKPFMVGVLAGAALCAVFAALLWPRGADSPTVSAVGESAASPSLPKDAAPEPVSPTPILEALATVPSETGYGTWSASETYLGGDRALYKGHIYRAKWWTLGETPGTADVWEDTGTAPATPAAAPTPTAVPAARQSKAPGDKTGQTVKVVGYYPSWKPGETGKLRFDVLTHVIYAFAIPTAEGGLRPLENPDAARKIIEQAHQNGVKVLLAVGGWSYNDVPLESTFVSATATEAKRKAFVEAILSQCDSYGFDGVDMDWEHPRVDGGSAGQYEALMLTLAQRLHARGKLLTSAVLSGATPDGTIYYDAAAHSDKVLQAVDWINVMAYDGGDGQRHSTYEFASACGTYWTATRGLAPSKVVLGMPFYARPSWAGYGDLLKADKNASHSDHILYNGMEAWYNGMGTITKKTRYAAEKLGGVMIWEVTQDAADRGKSLMTAIAAGLKK